MVKEVEQLNGSALTGLQHIGGLMAPGAAFAEQIAKSITAVSIKIGEVVGMGKPMAAVVTALQQVEKVTTQGLSNAHAQSGRDVAPNSAAKTPSAPSGTSLAK